MQFYKIQRVRATNVQTLQVIVRNERGREGDFAPAGTQPSTEHCSLPPPALQHTVTGPPTATSQHDASVLHITPPQPLWDGFLSESNRMVNVLSCLLPYLTEILETPYSTAANTTSKSPVIPHET